MAEDLMHKKEPRPIVMLYFNKTAQEIAYRDVFNMAEREIGLKTLYAVTDEMPDTPDIVSGFLSREMIEREIPDYLERIFYISGPYGIIESGTVLLHEMGVPRRNIKTDFFPGFV